MSPRGGVARSTAARRLAPAIALLAIVFVAGCTAETEPTTGLSTTSGNVAATLNAKVTWQTGERGYWRWELSESSTFASGVTQTTRRDFGPMGGSGGPVVIDERVRSSSCAGVTGACTVIASLKPSTRYYVRFCGELFAPGSTGYRCFDSDSAQDPPHEYDSFVTAPSAGDFQTDAGIAYARCPAMRVGTAGADTVFLSGSDDGFDGLGGQDQINGGAGSDCVLGSYGNDTVNGGDGNDVIAGGPGQDQLQEFSGNDDVDATDWPATGIDTVNAGSGNDDVKADDGAPDTIDCGPGQDRVDADAVDTILATCERRVDLFGRVVYHAREWSAAPASGGELMAEEWVDTFTRSGRRQEPGWLATRGLVPCDDNQPYGPQCAEVRERTTFSDTDPTQADTYYVQRGLSHDDPTVKNVADLLDAVPPDGSANARGPLSGVLQSWQVAPPGAGTEYLRFDEADSVSVADPVDGPDGEQPELPSTQIRTQLWVEQTTHMPLRFRVETLSGQLLSESFWTYEPGYVELSTLPIDFFLAPRPVNVEQDEEVISQSVGAEAGSTSGAVTSSLDFDAHHLGEEVVTGEGRFCLARLAVIRVWERPGADSMEPPPGGNAGGLVVQANAAYNRLGNAESCRPGTGSLESPELEVNSTASAGALADSWRYAFRTDGIPVPRKGRSAAFDRGLGMPSPSADAATARVVPLTPRTSAVLVESGRTTVTVTGPHAEEASAAQVAELANRLEVMR